MKALPDYYLKAMQLAAHSVETIGHNSARLPDINTPHGYLMRSRLSRRDAGGYLLSWIRHKPNGDFAGMGSIGAATFDVLAVRTRGAYNRQHSGKSSIRELQKYVKNVRGK